MRDLPVQGPDIYERNFRKEFILTTELICSSNFKLTLEVTPRFLTCGLKKGATVP